MNCYYLDLSGTVVPTPGHPTPGVPLPDHPTPGVPLPGHEVHIITSGKNHFHEMNGDVGMAGWK